MRHHSKVKVTAALIALALTRTSTTHEVDADYSVKPITLPGTTGAVLLDHLAYDPANGTVWVPGSNTGNIYVISGKPDLVSVVSGFNAGEVELEGQKAKMGPTAASVGEDVVYIGNRADFTLCTIDAHTFKSEGCVDVKHQPNVADAGPHSVSYIAATHEVWITTGPGKSIQVFNVSDAKHPKWSTEISLETSCEGYAVDNARGRFYTNLNEAGKTVAIDVRSHKRVAQWNLDSHDAQGIALDTTRGLIFVACTDHAVSFDANHDNRSVDSIVTGAGIDDIAFSGQQNVLYAAAGVTATLAIVEVNKDGKFCLKALVPTVKGARGVTAANEQTAYVIDPAGGRVLKVSHQ